MYATTKTTCVGLMFTPNQLPMAEEQTCLTTDHEEADTHLILHAPHVGGPVIIESTPM